MNSVTTLAAWALGIISSAPILLEGSTQHIFTKQPDIISRLGPQLSPNASILLPGSADFRNATTRWQLYREPEIDVVVEVANDQDVQRTILYANERGIPYLAKVGGHGAINSLGDVHHGIQISMRQLNHVRISNNGDLATIGGGAKVKDVVDALWSAGKQTVTGVCECVGMLGPMLGGGHGLLQGQHGLLADQLVEAQIVLANGTALTVSQNSHPDLFWAMRGAGHNFGIVTEFKYKIYNVSRRKWAYEALTFTSDKLEDLYQLTNEMMKTQPSEVMNYAIIFRVPAVDVVNPVILYFILYDGPAAAEQKYSAPVHALGPVDVQAGEADYPQLPYLTGNGNEDLACQPGAVALRFPIDLKSYDVPALRRVYDAFSTIMQDVPAFNNSFFLLEGYPVHAVQAVPAHSTAYPHRSDTLLLSPVVYYQPNSSLDALAIEFGKSARDILKSASGSSELHSYVNYAHGDESLESLYRYERWRLEKLRALKKEYDPHGRFSFYAPIS